MPRDHSFRVKYIKANIKIAAHRHDPRNFCLLLNNESMTRRLLPSTLIGSATPGATRRAFEARPNAPVPPRPASEADRRATSSRSDLARDRAAWRWSAGYRALSEAITSGDEDTARAAADDLLRPATTAILAVLAALDDPDDPGEGETR